MLSQRSTYSSIWWTAAVAAMLVASSCYPDFDSLSSEWGSSAGKAATAGSGGVLAAGGEGGETSAVNGGEETGGTSSAGKGGSAGMAGSVTTQGGEGGEGTVPMSPPCTPSVLNGAAPVAAYDLDDGTGNVVEDSSAAMHDAALAGGAWVAMGHTNGGIKFSSEGQRLTVPPEVVSTLDQVTFTAWVNLTSAAAGSTLLDLGTSADNHLALQVTDGTKLHLVVKTATLDLSLPGTYAVPLNRWTQVALTLGEGKAVVYLDGRPFLREDVALKPSDLGATASAWVGQPRGAGTNLLGTIDDVAFYDRVLDQRELMHEVLLDADYQYFTFDEFCSEGTMALPVEDAEGTEATASKLPVGATLIEGRIGQAVRLDANLSQYVELPAGVVQGCTDLTIAAWVYMDTVNTWARVFDLGTGTSTFMYLSPATPYDTIRFAAKLNAPDSTAEQVLSSNGILESGKWHHLAVVLSKNTGIMYLDGEEGPKNNKITMNPSDMGKSLRNWLGRSQYDVDPYFNGKFDELVISCRPFTVDEVRLLAKLAP